MEAYSTQETPLPGSSIPIRAPLTIDSDSDICLSINDNIYSRTSSFNSSCSSIDISNYGDEHTSILEEENDGFLGYPDEEIVLERSNVDEYTFKRPFVKYPDGNYDKVNIFRPFVKYPCEESSSGCKLGVPVAPLTGDCDSDVDSVDGCRWLDSERVSDDGVVQKVVMDPKVRILGRDEGEDGVDDELQVGSVSFGDDIDGLNSVSAESIVDEGCKVECSNEVMKCSESDDLSSDLERIDAQVVSSSNDEIESGTINGKHSESDELSFDILEGTDAQVVSDSNNETEVRTINVKHSESDELSFDILERTDEQVVSDSNNETKVGTINESEQEVVFDCYRNESKKILSEKEEETLAKMQPIREKFLSLALGKQLTMEVNGEGGNDKFDFHFTILVIGKTGVGKSATINSIFGQKKALTNAFDPGTTTIQEIIGNVDGIQLRVIDTPGLKCSPSEQSYNLRVLKSIKRFTGKHAPDVVLYVDRLDTHTQEVNDSQLLRLITGSLGSLVWRNCIIALTHANSNLPDEPLGGFMLSRCHYIKEQIVSFGGSNQYMANPVWLVENHPSYKHDSIDSGLEGLVCFDPAIVNECDQVPPFEPLSKCRDVTKRSVERKKAYFKEHSYGLKLLGNKHWSLGCRLYS